MPWTTWAADKAAHVVECIPNADRARSFSDVCGDEILSLELAGVCMFWTLILGGKMICCVYATINQQYIGRLRALLFFWM